MLNQEKKTEVSWVIKNPVPNGKCELNLARGHTDENSSFKSLTVEGNGYDSGTGKFNCGDPKKIMEEVIVRLPYDTSCPDCVLQWVYDAPGYGKIYECSDISIVDKEHREDCDGKCQNGGVCENKK